MSTTVYFLIWAVAIFLMMRFGCGAHVTGHGENKHGTIEGTTPDDRETLSWIPPDKDVDPVCGKSISTDGAKPSVHNGDVFYFCSRDCREIFEAAPDQYVGSQAEVRLSQMENQHV